MNSRSRTFMKPFSLTGIFLAIACNSLTSLTAQQQTDPELLRLGNGIAAIAEGQIITVEELRRELEPIIPRLRVESRSTLEFSKRVDKISREVLQNMIDRIIIVQAAEDKGLLLPPSYIDQEYDEVLERNFGGDRSRFLEYLRARGETPRDFRADIYKRVVVSVMRSETRRSQSEISPERIEEFYVRNKIRFYQGEALHLRQIILTPLADEGLVPLRQTAKMAIHELDNGANFSDIARKYSQDEMSRQGGDWGWIERKDIRKELSDIAFNLEPGEYSQPVELSGTIFILYAEDKREEMIQPVSQVRDIIENVLVGEIARETQEKWLQDLRNEAYIRYFM
jgi:peptidyl-prolyl cis-trans isomerase SurA